MIEARGIGPRGWTEGACKRLNDGVAELGHDCGDHSLDATYKRACRFRKQRKFKKCYDECLRTRGQSEGMNLDIPIGLMAGCAAVSGDPEHKFLQESLQLLRDTCTGVCARKFGYDP
jgi:hypothetical protein